jgi:hypothetical protein
VVCAKDARMRYLKNRRKGIMLIKSHYARDKAVREVRYMTRDEARKLSSGDYVSILGYWARVKVTSVKTWKRDLDHVAVHLRYGMYEFFIEEYTKTSDTTNLVILVGGSAV